MRETIFGAILTCIALSASAADDSVFGTHWVQFQPVQVKGEIQGCQLTFLTVTADRAYLNGNQVAVNGSIVLRITDNAFGLMLKVGLKDITFNSAFHQPAFAYLQTATFSTAKAPQQSVDGEPGYKLFVYSSDKDTMGVLKELISTGKASIGYNRKKDGIDVIAPLDLMVTDVEYTKDQKVVRTRSPEVASGFAECTVAIIDRALGQKK